MSLADQPTTQLLTLLQAYTFLPITCMLVSLFWFFFLHPIKAWKKDRLGLSILALSHLTKPLLFVTFGGTSFLQGYLLMMAAYWVTSECLRLVTGMSTVSKAPFGSL